MDALDTSDAALGELKQTVVICMDVIDTCDPAVEEFTLRQGRKASIRTS